MISGAVNAQLEARVLLQIEDLHGHLHAIDAVIDTGFSGDLSLRSAEVAALGLLWVRRQLAQLADGSVHWIDVHDAVLHWDGYPIQVAVQAVESDPLVGMKLLYGHEVKVLVVPGGAVSVAAIP